MIEQIVLTGGKHVKATDVRNALMENLEPLQKYFEQFGTCLLDGCEITSNVGTPANFDIAEGLVCIRHADGFKLARFAGVTNVVLPGYLTITKTTQQGTYGTAGNEVTKDIQDVYWAAFTSGAPAAGNDTELVIPTPTTGNITTIVRAMGSKAGSITDTRNTTTYTAVADTINFRLNEFNNTLAITANLSISDYASLSYYAQELFSNALSENMRPAAKRYFTAHVIPTGSNFRYMDYYNVMWVRDIDGYLDTDGKMYLHHLAIQNNSSYTVRINVIIPLD